MLVRNVILSLALLFSYMPTDSHAIKASDYKRSKQKAPKTVEELQAAIKEYVRYILKDIEHQTNKKQAVWIDRHFTSNATIELQLPQFEKTYKLSKREYRTAVRGTYEKADSNTVKFQDIKIVVDPEDFSTDVTFSTTGTRVRAGKTYNIVSNQYAHIKIIGKVPKITNIVAVSQFIQ